MIKNVSISIFLLLLSAPSVHAFVGAIHLFEKDDDLVLVIGDRHMTREALPEHLLAKESADFRILTPFVSDLVRKDIRADWVLESSKSRVVKDLFDADSLLTAMGWYFTQVEQQYPHSGTKGIQSDFRRYDVAQVLLRLHHEVFAPLIIECFERLKEMDQWTPEEIDWFGTKEDIMAHDLVPIVNRYFLENDEFAAFLIEKLTERLQQLEAEEHEWIGETLKFGRIKKIFTDLENELDGDRLAPAKRDIQACQSELNGYLQEMDASEDSTLAESILAKVKKTRSLTSLDFGVTKLSDCTVHSVADAGFFHDVMKSQNAGHFTVLFAGRGHGTVISKYLKEIGYVPLFEEGQMIKIGGHALTIQVNGEDHLVEDSVMKSRLRETFKRVSARNNKEEL